MYPTLAPLQSPEYMHHQAGLALTLFTGLKHLKNPGKQNVKTTGSWLELQEASAKVASWRETRVASF